MKAQETVDFPIRWVWAKISRMYNAEAAAYGGTMSIGYALLNIDREEGTPSTKLGPLMGMEPTSLTRTLKKMEEDNLITRKRDEIDKRKVHLFLTTKGLDLREKARESVLNFNKKIYKQIGEEKLKNFFEVMSDISEIVESEKLVKNQ